MDAVTYPNRKVIELLQNRVIPLQLESSAQPYATDYCVKWTPNLLIIDGDGKEYHRIIGFLPPVELIPSVLLGIGKGYFGKDELKEAIGCFEEVISEYPHTSSAPEAIFFRGVAGYKSTHQTEHLKEAYRKLQVGYHFSEWSRRAYPYWLLP